MEQRPFDSSREETEQSAELVTIEKLRELCEPVLRELGLEGEDIEKIFADADGSIEDALGAIYGYFLEAGEDPDEILAGLVYLNKKRKFTIL